MQTTLNPSEISELIKKRIEDLNITSETRNEGTVVSVFDGIARLLRGAMVGVLRRRSPCPALRMAGGMYACKSIVRDFALRPQCGRVKIEALCFAL